MNYQQSNWLFREVMPTVKNKSTFAVIAAVADATWGWNIEKAELSISNLAKSSGISEGSVRNALKDDDFRSYITQEPVDPTNLRLGYRYYVNICHSAMLENGIVPSKSSHSTPAESDIATSGSKESPKESPKEGERKTAEPEPAKPDPPHLNGFKAKWTQPYPKHKRAIMDKLASCTIDGYKKEAALSDAADGLIGRGLDIDLVVFHLTDRKEGFWFTVSFGKNDGLLPWASQLEDELFKLEMWLEHREQSASNDTWSTFWLPAFTNHTLIQDWPDAEKKKLRAIGGQQTLRMNPPNKVLDMLKKLEATAT